MRRERAPVQAGYTVPSAAIGAHGATRQRSRITSIDKSRTWTREKRGTRQRGGGVRGGRPDNIVFRGPCDSLVDEACSRPLDVHDARRPLRPLPPPRAKRAGAAISRENSQIFWFLRLLRAAREGRGLFARTNKRRGKLLCHSTNNPPIFRDGGLLRHIRRET